MKTFYWIVAAAGALGITLCVYGYATVEPDFFELGVGGVVLALIAVVVAKSITWFIERQQQTVPCAQCEIHNRRSEMRFGRCSHCREQNRQEAAERARLEREQRMALAKLAEEIKERQLAVKSADEWPTAPVQANRTQSNDLQTASQQNATIGNIAVCPRCQSPSVQLMKRGYSAGVGTFGCCLSNMVAIFVLFVGVIFSIGLTLTVVGIPFAILLMILIILAMPMLFGGSAAGAFSGLYGANNTKRQCLNCNHIW